MHSVGRGQRGGLHRSEGGESLGPRLPDGGAARPPPPDVSRRGSAPVPRQRHRQQARVRGLCELDEGQREEVGPERGPLGVRLLVWVEAGASDDADAGAGGGEEALDGVDDPGAETGAGRAVPQPGSADACSAGRRKRYLRREV